MLQDVQGTAKQVVGKIAEFDEEVESFENYCERLDHFFTINSVKDENKLSYFVAIMGPVMSTKLKDLFHPKKLSEVDFKTCLKTLKDHFVPKSNTTYERFLFNKRSQKDSENISEYACQLKKLASTCDFGAFLDEALRDFCVALDRQQYKANC